MFKKDRNELLTQRLGAAEEPITHSKFFHYHTILSRTEGVATEWQAPSGPPWARKGMSSNPQRVIHLRLLTTTCVETTRTSDLRITGPPTVGT